MTCVVLVPMLGRPHRVAPLLASLRATCDARPLFVVSPDDLEVHDAVDREGEQRITVDWEPAGDYARKTNAGYQATDEPLLFLGADDLLFHPGWLEAATAKMTGKVGVVGTNDLCNPRTADGRHSTHSLVSRAYADEFGTLDGPGAILFEGYVHEWSDDELVGTARKRRAYAHAADSHVEHLHPMNGKAPMDASYSQQGERMQASRALYLQRRRRWR